MVMVTFFGIRVESPRSAGVLVLRSSSSKCGGRAPFLPLKRHWTVRKRVDLRRGKWCHDIIYCIFLHSDWLDWITFPPSPEMMPFLAIFVRSFGFRFLGLAKLL